MNNSSILTNSKRCHEKRTYTPLIIADAAEGESSNVLGLATQARVLMISDSEFAQLRHQSKGEGQLAAINALQNLSTAISAQGVLAAALSLAKVAMLDLHAVSEALGSIRSEAANNLTSAVHQLDQTHTFSIKSSDSNASHEANSSNSTTLSTSQGIFSETGLHHNARLNPVVTHGRAADGTPSPSRLVDLHRPEIAVASARVSMLSLISATQPKQTKSAATNRLLVAAVGPQLAERAPSVIAWAADKKPDLLSTILNLAQPYAALSLTADPATQITTALTNLSRLRLLTQLFSESLTQRPLQPIGLLYLERLEMLPIGIERGELAYSLPLAPNEKVTLAHREWSVHEEQFSEFIEDFMENFSEQGVAQTNDIALSTSTQTSHNNALSMSQPIASAPGLQTTTPIDTTSLTVDDTISKDESKSQSRTVTALASTRTMKDHKISFTVTTVSGMEDFTAHLIENKHEDQSMRIDYFKRVRNWRSNLYRYGVRLTYDVVLPDPSARLRKREVELQNIANELSTEFQLYLLPSEIQPDNWEQLADQYQVVLPAPPYDVQQIEKTQPLSYRTPWDSGTGINLEPGTSDVRETPLDLSIPTGYKLDRLNVFAETYTATTLGIANCWIEAFAGRSVNSVNVSTDGYCRLDWDLNGTQVPSTGQITVIFFHRGTLDGLLRLTATVVPTEATLEQWRLSCWAIIRDGATAVAAQHRSYLRDRQAALQKQIASDDPVRLRRMEREEIMRAVLEWLFPGFEDASSVLGGLPSPGSLDPGTWQQVMQYGEYIKFVQTAIDWDNVMVFLYPYFWDTVWHEQEKLFLYHPDPVHREFLRAGAARVILATEPGFEEQVVALLDQGQLGNLPDQNRFSTAIKYVIDTNTAYAQTAKGSEQMVAAKDIGNIGQGGGQIGQGGGQAEDPNQPGVLIGSWTDYTPSSALDIDTTLIPVITSS